MKIQIEKEIEVNTDRNFDGLNAIIGAALDSSSEGQFKIIVSNNDYISGLDFFIYYGAHHIAVHEILPTGEKSERLLLISK